MAHGSDTQSRLTRFRNIHADQKTYFVPDDMTDQEIIQIIETDNPYFAYQKPASEPATTTILKLPPGAKLDDPKPGDIWEEQPISLASVSLARSNGTLLPPLLRGLSLDS
jgi:hypothetical protein